MLSSVGAPMAIVISISRLVLIAIVTSTAENSVVECQDNSLEVLPIKFTVTVILTLSASHFYVVVSVFFCFECMLHDSI